MSCLCGGDSYAERKALKESSCTISCRGEVSGGKKQSIMITLPNGKTVTFFEDGWCNPNNKKNSIRKERLSEQIIEGYKYKTYTFGIGTDQCKISFRENNKENEKESVMIVDNNGNGVCIYDDGWVDPVKGNQTVKNNSQQIDCNLFEFIKGNFLDNPNSVNLKTNLSFNQQLNRISNRSAEQSLLETKKFTIKL